jgi:hypothetical protein
MKKAPIAEAFSGVFRVFLITFLVKRRLLVTLT